MLTDIPAYKEKQLKFFYNNNLVIRYLQKLCSVVTIDCYVSDGYSFPGEEKKHKT